MKNGERNNIQPNNIPVEKNTVKPPATVPDIEKIASVIGDLVSIGMTSETIKLVRLRIDMMVEKKFWQKVMPTLMQE